MSYETLRRSALPHGLIAVLAVVGVLFGVTAAGAMTAAPATQTDAGRYQIGYSMNLGPRNQIVTRLRLFDTETKETISEPRVTTQPGLPAQVTLNREERDFIITITPRTDASGTLKLVVKRGSDVLQETTLEFPAPAASEEPQFSGAPLSLNLAKADLRDVIQTFAEMTGINIAMTADVKGSVNVNVTDMPWDQAFDQIVRDAGFAWRRTETGIEVFKP